MTSSSEMKDGPFHVPSAHALTLSIIASLVVLASATFCLGQPKSELRRPAPIDPARAEREGQELVADLLAQKPDKSMTNTGVLTIRDVKNQRTEIRARFEVISTATNWVSVFETLAEDGKTPAERLVVVHWEGPTNEYRLFTGKQDRVLAGNQTMIPFAGSDFWIADLGLEFLRWPKQRLLAKEMRRHQFCGVLESTNPHESTNGYRRVVSWIDLDTGAIVHADAYDSRNQLLKQFDPTELKKVSGKHELEEMEMRNRQTHSQSRIKFNLQ